MASVLRSKLVELVTFGSIFISIGSMTLVQLESYSKPVGSLCIAIPPEGESYGKKITNVSGTEISSVHSTASPLNSKSLRGVHTHDKFEDTASNPSGGIRKKRSSPSHVSIDDDWVLIRPEDLTVTWASLQYIAETNSSNMKLWVGEAIIPNELMTFGHHILTYEQITVNGQLGLRVWWDNEELPFKSNTDRNFSAKIFKPSRVILYGPPKLLKSARALCYADGSSFPSRPNYQAASTIAIVAVSILGTLLLLAAVAAVLVKRFSRADSLEVAGYTPAHSRISDIVVGSRSYEEDAQLRMDNNGFEPIEATE